MAPDKTITAGDDSTRRKIIRRLADAPSRAGELARGFASSRLAIGKHTRVLSKAGLSQVKKNGRERIYEPAPSGGKAMEETIDQFETMQRLWDIALEAFKKCTEEK